MRPILLLVPFATATTFVLPAQAPATATVDRLLVCNKGAASVSLFDPATRREIAALPTGEGPHEVAVAPDGRTAVVANYGGREPGRTLTVVDVAAAKVLRTLELGERRTDGGEPRTVAFARPHGLHFVDAGHVLVTSEAARRLLLVDVASGAIDRQWPTPQRTMHMVAAAPDGHTAYTTSVAEGDLAAFDLTASTPGTPLFRLPTGEGSEGLATDPRRGAIWVANRTAHTLAVVDPRTHTIAATIPTGDLPFRIAFTHDGAQALVTCAEAGEVQRFDAAKHTPLGAVTISGEGSELSPLPMGIVVDPDDHFAWVTCGRGEFVAVLDLAKSRVVDRIVARAGPDGLGYARFTPAK